MYQSNRSFDPYNLDTMLALSPRSNQYPMSPADNVAGGYGSIGGIDKILMMIAKAGLAGLEGTAVDPTQQGEKTNFPTGKITNEMLPTQGANQVRPKKYGDPNFEWSTGGGKYFFKLKGTDKWYVW